MYLVSVCVYVCVTHTHTRTCTHTGCVCFCVYYTYWYAVCLCTLCVCWCVCMLCGVCMLYTITVTYIHERVYTQCNIATYEHITNYMFNAHNNVQWPPVLQLITFTNCHNVNMHSQQATQFISLIERIYCNILRPCLQHNML